MIASSARGPVGSLRRILSYVLIAWPIVSNQGHGYRAAHRKLYAGRLWINRLARSAVLHPPLTSNLLGIVPNQQWMLWKLTKKVVRL